MDQIAVCLPVLENYAKLQEQMNNRKYYQALKTLEELEHTHLALVEKYRFTQVLAKSMAPVRLEIKEKAYSEFKDFLENIKKVAARIGKHASKDVSKWFQICHDMCFSIHTAQPELEPGFRKKAGWVCSKQISGLNGCVYGNSLVMLLENSCILFPDRRAALVWSHWCREGQEDSRGSQKVSTSYKSTFET